MSKALTFTICMVFIVVLTACASPEYRGQTVINRESIQISRGVASLVMDSDAPVVLEEDKRIICARTVVTGSRMPFTYCQTREEYEDYLRISQELIRNEQGTGVR